MDIDAYIKYLKDVLGRIDTISCNTKIESEKWQLNSVKIQLRFILHYAESGESFKQGLLERKREEFKILLERYPTKDAELINAIQIIYADLDAHDYNAGGIDQDVGGYYFELLGKKYLYYDEITKKKTYDSEERNSSLLADAFSSDLIGGEYHIWSLHGIKNLQYFFLVNVFSYVNLTTRVLDNCSHPDAVSLNEDIWQISQFYETTEAEGTHMWLNPVELKEISGEVHLVDLKGNVLE